jgi:hypothetical protein
MMKQSPQGGGKARRRLTVRAASLATGLLTVLGFAAGYAVQPAAAANSSAVTTTNLGYNPLTPARVADTRPGASDPSTYANDTLCSSCALTVDIPGLPANAGAIVAQVTAIGPQRPGYLSVYPTGQNPPGTANVLFTTGQTVGNLVTVGLGTDPANNSAAVDVYNGPSGGKTDFTLDLYGYYAPQTGSSGDAYQAITPFRLLDTRSTGTPLGPGSTVNIPVSGVGGISSGAGAVALNVAVTDTTAPSYLQCYPTGQPPSSSTPSVNQNWNPGETLSTQVISGVSSGSVTCKNAAGSADIVVDADGYYTGAGGSGSLFNALGTPVRLLDTRPGGIPAGGTTNVSVAGSNGVPANATAAAGNLTDIANGQNYMTAYPQGGAQPLAANINYTTGDPSSTLSNGVYVGIGQGFTIFNAASSANAVFDLMGFFAPSSNTGNLAQVTSISPTSGAGGTSVTPTISNQGTVTSASVSGCGLNSQTLTGPSYTFAIPAGATPGTCTLTFSVTNGSGTSSSSFTFNVSSPSNSTGFVSAISPNSGPAGQVITLTVQNPNGVNSEAVSGCGITNQPITKNPSTGTFQVTIPATTAQGACQLTFTSTNNDGTPSQTSNLTFTVTPPASQIGTLTTNGPDLTSTSIVQNGNGSSTPSVVQYVFDKPVTCGPTTNLANFMLVTNDPSVSTNTQINPVTLALNTPTNCQQATGNTNAVNVTFPAGVIAASYPLAVVQNTSPAGTDNATGGAVVGTQPSNGDGLPNPLGAVALSGSTAPSGTTPGLTASPQLMSTTNVDQNTEVFTFNQPLKAATCTAGDFAFYQSPGTPPGGITGSGCTVTGSNAVTVTWTGTPGQNAVQTATRFTVVAGAVQASATTNTNPDGWTPGVISGPSGPATTTQPDLSQIATTANPNVYNFTFNAPVNCNNSNNGAGAGDYLLYSANYSNGATTLAAALGVTAFAGTTTGGTTPIIQNGPDTCAVTFAIPAAQQPNITLGSYDNVADPTPANIVTDVVGSEPITLSGSGNNVGVTNGPDLIGVARSGPNTIQYTFDKGITAATAGDFFALSASGVANFGTAAITSNNGTVVTVTFSSASIVAGAQAAGLVTSIAAENSTTGAPGDNPDSAGIQAAPGDLTLG